MIDFEQFSDEARARGYQPARLKDRPVFFIKTRNKVKVEINVNARAYVAGYGLDEEHKAALKQEMAARHEAGELELIRPASPQVWAKYSGMAEFWRIVEIIEQIEEIVAKSRGLATRVFSKDVAEHDIFRKIAKTYRFALEIEHQNLLDTVRNLQEADRLDHLICRGQSRKHTEDDSYREHVVPCVLIHNEAIRLLLADDKSDAAVERVARLIEDNLAIVKITSGEQDRLDRVLGLRTCMPQGWRFGDSIYARLERAGIDWVPLGAESALVLEQ